MTVAKTLTQMVEKIAEKSGKARIVITTRGDEVDHEWWSLYWMCICDGWCRFQ